MRQDQFESLQQRAEQLIDLFLSESNPEKWPGHGIEPSAMEAKTRGDRYWCKKDAVATLACAQRIGNLIQLARQKTPDGSGAPEAVVPAGESDLDKDVRDAEKEAEAILNRANKSAQQTVAGKRVKKAEFDKKVHGKS